MTAAEREAMIAQWWEDVNGWEWLLVEATIGARLSRAFHQVLMAMPVDVCRKFLELTPGALPAGRERRRAGAYGPPRGQRGGGRTLAARDALRRRSPAWRTTTGGLWGSDSMWTKIVELLQVIDSWRFSWTLPLQLSRNSGRASYRDVDCLTGSLPENEWNVQGLALTIGSVKKTLVC